MNFPISAEILVPGLNDLPEEIREEVIVQGLRLGSTLILLLFSWLIGQRIISYWEIRRRIRESDLESENTFQRIHGEFKALWRIYKVHTKQGVLAATGITPEQPALWSLIERSSILEGEWEALLLKLASNRKLSAQDLTDLGLLRQLIQQLREGMKRGSALDEDFRIRDYELFHTLSARVLDILRRPHQFQSAVATDGQMQAILAVKPSDLNPHREISTAQSAVNGIKMKTQQHPGGFSFIELMLVLSITGVLLAFTAPSLLTLRSTGLTAAGREFGGFLNQCRAEAIAKRNALRIGIVVESTVADDARRKYAAWRWDKITKTFQRYSEWKFLPTGTVFENSETPSYLSNATYAKDEKSSVRGDFVLAAQDNTFEETDTEKNVQRIRFFTFTPSGRADLPMDEKRNLIIVMREDEKSSRDVKNWIQFNVDNLTGRTRIYRP